MNKEKIDELNREIRLINLNKTNMETKKKINWLKIWQIIRDILVTLLTTDAIVNKV